jgi:hypothetical protein
VLACGGTVWHHIEFEYPAALKRRMDPFLNCASARQEGETVTYFRREPDWIAVSGFKGGRIFYRKAVLACGGTVWHHIEFEYPAALKRRMVIARHTASITQKTTSAENLSSRRSRRQSVHFLKKAFSSSIFSDTSALVRLSAKSSGRWTCSHSVLR